MATTMISGLASTASPVANELKVDMHKKVAMLDPETSQFSTMLMKLPSLKANSFKIEWLEDLLKPRTSALAASAASDATALTVTTNEGNYFNANDIVRNTLTGEAFRVTTAGASALTVVRGIGTVTAASSASSATAGQLVIIGNSSAQGATLPTAIITQRTQNYNYTSIQRDSFRFTETAAATSWYTGDIVEFERFKKAVEHKRALENTLFFGARSYSAATPPQHASGGVAEFLASATNSTSATTLDKGTLNDFMRTGLQYGSHNKVLFAAPIVAQVISEFLQDNWVRAKPSERVWGAKVDAYISAVYGVDVPVIVKREWGGYSTGTGRYGSLAYLIDLENVEYRPLRPTQYLPNVQANDADEFAGEFKTEFSFRLARESTHAKLTDVAG